MSSAAAAGGRLVRRSATIATRHARVCVFVCVCRGGERNSRTRRKEGRGREEGGDKRKFVTWPPWPAAPPRSHTSQQGVINCLYSHASTPPPPAPIPPLPPPPRAGHVHTEDFLPCRPRRQGAARLRPGEGAALHSITHLSSAFPFLSSGRGGGGRRSGRGGRRGGGEGRERGRILHTAITALPFPVQNEGEKGKGRKREGVGCVHAPITTRLHPPLFPFPV